MSYEPPGFSRKSVYGHEKLYESSSKVGSTFLSSEKPVANGAGRSLSRHDEGKQRRNYKLLIDPALKKGAQKIFRYDGEFDGQSVIVPKDPRSRRTRIWTLNKADLPVPNFKVDKYYVGTPPQREVVFTGLNDNVDRKFLQEMCMKYGKVENIKIYYDPLTKKHTGKAKVTFDLTKSAKLACSKLDGCSVMGNIISTQLEPNLKGLVSRLKQQKSLEKPPFLHTGKPPLHFPTPPSTNSRSPSLDSTLSATPTTPQVSRPVDPRIRNPPAPVTPPLPDVSPSVLSSRLQQRSSVSSQLSLSGHGSVFSAPLSSTSSFEPISPPPLPKKDLPLPVEDTPLEGAPPLPPPVEQASSFINYEDISPEQTYSPEDKGRKMSSTQDASKTTTTKTSGRSTCDESKISKMIETLRKDSTRHSPSREHSRSPKSDKYSSRDYRSHESRHYNDYDDKGDRYRDRYGDHHRDYRDDKDYSSRRDNKRSDSSRYSGRGSSYRHYESWKDSHTDYKSRKSDYSRSSYRDDYDRRYGDRQKDSSKYKRSDRYTTSPRRPEDRDKYSDSPHRGEEKRKSESNDSHGKEDLRTREWHSRKSPNDYTENKNTDTYGSNREERRSASRTERSLSPHRLGKSPVASSLGSPKEVISDPPLSVFSSGKSISLDKYETSAYGGDEEASNEEPLPPGEDKPFFHEQHLEITRMELPNTQETVRKRKLSHETEDDDSRTKRLNLDNRGTHFSESESESHTTDLARLRGSQQVPEAIGKEGGIVVMELNGTDDTTHAGMLQVEDISPCQSPLAVTTVAGNAVVKSSDSNNLYSDIETNDDTETENKNDGQNDDDDNMSLSSISSNEDTFELNEPSKKISPKNQPVTIPPPNIFTYPPAIIPPPPPVIYNPHVPPPGMPFPPPPLPPMPGIPPPIPPPSLPLVPPIPPHSVLPPVQPASVPYSSTYPPHPRLTGYGQGFEYRPTKQEKLWNWKRQIIDVVSGVVRNELDAVLTRDVFRKLVEASAFKSLEAWWENQRKPKITSSVPSTVQHTSTVAQPTSSTPSTLLGPSPFDRSHSMAMGLRASLPKLPSFKRRALQPKPDVEKAGEGSKSLFEKIVESPLSLKRRRAYDSESEHDTEVELSSREGDKRRRTVSGLVDDGDDERSQSPWQHLDDEAPAAMDVRISKATDRRVSTGSSLYKTIYSSESEEESESEAESEEKEESEDEQAESEEEREEYESETESSEEETEEESEEESEESEEENEEETEKEKMEVEFKKPVISDDAEETDRSFSGTSQSQMLESEISDIDKEDTDETATKSTVETITLSQTTNYDQTSGLAIQPRIDKMEVSEKEKELTTDTEATVSEEEVELLADNEEEKPTVSTEGKEPEEKVDKEVEEITDKEEEEKPSLSPHIQSIASLVELDHSYGLVRREETPPIDVITVDQETPDSKFTVNEKEFQDKLEEFKEDKKAKAEKKLPPPLPKHVFPVRSFEQDDELVYEFLKTGLDYEDAHFLKVGFDQLVQVCSDSVAGAKWSFHPVTAQPTNTPTPKRRRQKSELGIRQHVTGCARSEGYYKIDSKEKAKYAESAHGIVQHDNNVAAVEEPKLDASKGKQMSRENRAMQRRLQSAVCNEDFGDILKFNKLRVRKKQLKFAKSPIHDWGLVALEPIAADEMVIEYLGERIRQVIADNRERSYERKGIGSSYMFRLDEETIIDATVKGNFARFINHCCDPNCYAKVIALENEKKIVIYSKRDIKVNEEITYDYKFPLEDEKIPCLCGSPSCRGTLN